MNDRWPQIAVVGAGGVGGYFGGVLAHAGAPVTMIGRQAFAEAVNEHGLVIESPQGEVRVFVEAATEMSATAKADVVLFCVKTSDNEETARALAASLKRGALVMSLQNGVDNVARIREASGINAFATVVYVAASVVRPGIVRHLARGDLVVGADARALADLFARANIPCRISQNLDAELWTKLSTNCALNALSALTRLSYGQIIATEEGRHLMNSIVDEVFAIACASGVQAREFTADSLRRAAFDLAQQMPTTMSSTAQDLARRKQTEIDSLNGFIARRGQELGRATPTNDLMRALIKIAEHG